MAGHPTCHVNVIKLKWEIIWTDGLPHLSGLPHLPGVPHLHVNRHSVCLVLVPSQIDFPYLIEKSRITIPQEWILYCFWDTSTTFNRPLLIWIRNKQLKLIVTAYIRDVYYLPLHMWNRQCIKTDNCPFKNNPSAFWERLSSSEACVIRVLLIHVYDVDHIWHLSHSSFLYRIQLTPIPRTTASRFQSTTLQTEKRLSRVLICRVAATRADGPSVARLSSWRASNLIVLFCRCPIIQLFMFHLQYLCVLIIWPPI